MRFDWFWDPEFHRIEAELNTSNLHVTFGSESPIVRRLVWRHHGQETESYKPFGYQAAADLR